MIASVIRQLAEEIDFASPEGLARRWYPLGRSRPIVLDPFVSFGAPSVVGRGVKTANIHDLFLAENESSAAVRAWCEDAKDPEYLPRVGSEGWFLATRDNRIRYRPAERAAMKEHEVGAFFMGGKNRNRCELIQQLVRNWPRMEGAGSQDSSALRISDPALRHEVQTPAVELTR